MDYGSGFFEVDQSQIRNKPYLNSYTVIGLTRLGYQHRFKIAIFNEIGSAESLAASFTLASNPD
jgi:hypothetical protein